MATIDSAALRVFIYDEIVGGGVVPSSASIADRFDCSPADARQSLANLNIGKTVLVDRESGEIWMAGPFSAVATPYRVVGNGRAWWANCAWDMFGVAVIAGERVTVQTRCTDCGEPMSLVCDPETAPADGAMVHFLLPANRWYEDIGFT